MTVHEAHDEHHYIQRVGWLRAAVLGANDGIVSTASLIVGVAAAAASADQILLAGIAALVAGAMSMAAGEYVSVSSQADTEQADLETERAALKDDPAGELEELSEIYRGRGLPDDLADQVAEALMKHDALGAHARDELGLNEISSARPVQAAASSAASFASGAILPLLAAVLAPIHLVTLVVTIVSLISLGVLGVLSARAGGADPIKASMRVMFWGAAAMAVTWFVGRLFGIAV